MSFPNEELKGPGAPEDRCFRLWATGRRPGTCKGGGASGPWGSTPRSPCGVPAQPTVNARGFIGGESEPGSLGQRRVAGTVTRAGTRVRQVRQLGNKVFGESLSPGKVQVTMIGLGFPELKA